MISLEQALALAPDAAARKAARELAAARKWSGLGRSERAAWGEHQGSGAAPYQARVDLRDTAFKCTCPSRKLPCKHSLGLLVALIESPSAFPTAGEPPWVGEWLAGREERAGRKARQSEAGATGVAGAGARERRAAQRSARIEDGLAELGTWLRDLVREGLASASRRPASYFDGMAARLVDAQAPGAARLVSRLGAVARSNDDVHRRMLAQMARLHLLVEGHGRVGSLPAEARADLRAALGFTIAAGEVLRGPALGGTWRVLGRRVEVEDRLRVARTWLWHAGRGAPALLLAFAAGSQPLDLTHAAGTELEAELVYYPGAVPLRALERSRQTASRPISSPGAGDGIAAAVAGAAAAFGSNPWLERVLLRLHAVTPAAAQGGWLVVDAAGHALPIAARWTLAWELVAASGGRPVSIYGEWDGRALWPLGAWTGDGFCDLGGEAA